MILMDDIIKDPNDILRTPAQDVTLPASDEVRKLAAEMMEYVINSQDEKLAEKYGLRPGVGLAATQVGKLLKMSSIAIPTSDVDPDKPDEKSYFFKGTIVNPEIISESATRAALDTGEGCLSVPVDIEGYVPRAQRITVRYYDLDGNQYEVKLRDYPAIVFQHEIDHMHGKLYYDYINPLDAWKHNDDVKYLG